VLAQYYVLNQSLSMVHGKNLILDLRGIVLKMSNLVIVKTVQITDTIRSIVDRNLARCETVILGRYLR